MGKNRSHEVLKHTWLEWRKASGNKYKQEYLDFIEMNNDGAHSLGIHVYLTWLYISWQYYFVILIVSSFY